MTAKPPFIQITPDLTKKQLASRAKAARRAFDRGFGVVVRLYVPKRGQREAAEDLLLSFIGRIGAMPQGKWDWRGRILDIMLVKGT